MSQAPTDTKDLAFDGRIQLNGDEAPELEVIVRLDDDFIVLGHSSGELGRWERNTVRVAPIGRGWFTLDVEDETVTFLPRRPGHFAASTVDLVPVEETKKRRWRRRKDKQEKAAEAPELSRKERKRALRQEAAATDVAPAEPTAAPAPPVAPVDEASAAPDQIEPAPAPRTPPADVAPPPAPGTRAPSAAPGPPAEPASPWDDLTVPEIPGRQTRRKKRSSSIPETAPPEPVKKTKPPKEKAPKPPKPPKATRGKAVKLAGSSRPVTRTGPRKKSAISRGFAGFWHGLKGLAFRVSDELRQTGIVPFDRLPAAPARSRPSENHRHDFQEHRLPGGLTRNVCHSCGLVSIGELSEEN